MKKNAKDVLSIEPLQSIKLKVPFRNYPVVQSEAESREKKIPFKLAFIDRKTQWRKESLAKKIPMWLLNMSIQQTKLDCDSIFNMRRHFKWFPLPDNCPREGRLQAI